MIKKVIHSLKSEISGFRTEEFELIKRLKLVQDSIELKERHLKIQNNALEQNNDAITSADLTIRELLGAM